MVELFQINHFGKFEHILREQKLMAAASDGATAVATLYNDMFPLLLINTWVELQKHKGYGGLSEFYPKKAVPSKIAFFE